MSHSSTLTQRLHAWLSDNPDQAMLRWIFRSVLVITIAVLALDLAGMNGYLQTSELAAAPAEIKPASPALDLPSMMPSVLAPWLPDREKRLVPLPQADVALAKPMTFELV